MPLNPTEYYPGQQSNEEIVLFLRKHWWSYMNWAWIIVLVCVVPWIFFGIMVATDVWGDVYNLSPSMPYFLTIFISVYYLFTLALFITTWIDYYLDVIIITKSTLVKIKQEGLFIRGVAEQNLVRVQDVTSQMKGPIQNMLKFGTVCVETAGEQPNFNLSFIENPHFVADTIMRLHKELVDNLSEEEVVTDITRHKEPIQEEKVIQIQVPKKTKIIEKTKIIKPKVNKIPSKPLVVDYKPPYEEPKQEAKIEKKPEAKNPKPNFAQTIKESPKVDVLKDKTPETKDLKTEISKSENSKNNTPDDLSKPEELEEGKTIKF